MSKSMGTKKFRIKDLKESKKIFEIKIGVCRIMNKFLVQNLIVRQEIDRELFADRQIKCIEDIIKIIKEEK